MDRQALQAVAWDLLCKDMAGDAHQYDFWVEVPQDIRLKYIEKAMKMEAPVSSFSAERSKSSDESTRYGKNIIDNFNPDEDLVFWKLKQEHTRNGYWVTMIHPEISALCPVSGYPDSGKVTVEFCPSEHTVELKAFKLWLNSYRNTNISHEDLANEIYNTLLAGLSPKHLYVKLEMMPRGNVTTIVEVGFSFTSLLKAGKLV